MVTLTLDQAQDSVFPSEWLAADMRISVYIKTDILEWNGFRVGDEVTVSYHEPDSPLIRRVIGAFYEEAGEIIAVGWHGRKGVWDKVTAIRPLDKPGIRAHENNLDYEVVFADTLIEDPDLYRFNDDLAKIIDVPITVLRDGRDPYQVFIDQKYIGNSRTAPCSQILKTQQVKNYIGDRDVTLILGMGLSETERLNRAKQAWSPVKVDSLLIQYRIHTREQQEEILSKYNLEIPRLYKMGFPHNNCGGFCVRAGLRQFATLYEKLPETYMYHENKLNETLAQIPKGKPFLKDRNGGETKYITLTEFRELYSEGRFKKVSPFDYQGCGCFVDDDPNNFETDQPSSES